MEGLHIHVPPAHTGSIGEAMATSPELGLEGVVAKRTDGRYLPGKHSPDWLKIKDERHQEVIVIGWHKGSGQRSGSLGSLLLAVNDGGRLRYPTWRGWRPDKSAPDVQWEACATPEGQAPIGPQS